MAKYSYSESDSFIDKIDFEQSDNGSTRAYLHTKSCTSTDHCQNIITALTNAGWYTIPFVKDGNISLEVRGYVRQQSVLDLLANNQWIKGKPKIEETKDNRSWLERSRGKTLQGTSIFFLAADASYSRYGYLESRPEDVAAGIAYGIGSASMGLFGTNAQAVDEIKKQTRKLIKFAKEHSWDLSNNFTLPIVTENNKRDVWHKILDTLQTYPAEIGNSFTGLAGALIAFSSYKYKLSPKTTHAGKSKASGYMDFGLGLSTLTSGMIGAFVKEKKRDPDEKAKQGIEGIWEWIKERPLSIAAFGYMCSTLCHTGSTIKEYYEAKASGNAKTLKAVPWRAGFIGCTIIAEMLLMLSSKGHGDGVKSDVSTEDSMISIAAEIIAQQKPELQTKIIEEMAEFLGRPDILGIENKQTEQRLRQAVDEMHHNPWAKIYRENSSYKDFPKSNGKWQEKLGSHSNHITEIRA